MTTKPVPAEIAQTFADELRKLTRAGVSVKVAFSTGLSVECATVEEAASLLAGINLVSKTTKAKRRA